MRLSALFLWLGLALAGSSHAQVVQSPCPANASGCGVTATGSTTAVALKDWFTHLIGASFGATGDGTTNDTTALQALLNSGKPVFLKAGTYSVTCLTVPSGLRLSGAGPAVTIIKSRAGSACPTMDADTATDVEISGVTIDANHEVDYAIFSETSSDRWRIQNTTIKNADLDCIRIRSSSDLVISGNTITGCTQHGITVTTNATRFSIANNTITSVGGAGIIFSVGIDGSIHGNHMDTVGNSGECVTGYSESNLRVTISNNSCTASANNGIHVGGTSISVIGNQINGMQLSCIFMGAVDAATNTVWAPSYYYNIQGNNCAGTAAANQIGVFIRYAFNGTVTGNTVTGATQSGIGLTLSDNNVVSANNIKSTTGNGVVLRGSKNNSVSGNYVNASSADGYRTEQDTSNATGGGTVTATGNFLTGNFSIANQRDYIDGTGGSSNTYQINYATGATSGTSPNIVMGASSPWVGTVNTATGAFQIGTPGGPQILVKDIASATNYIAFTGGGVGAAPKIEGLGSDSNRDLNIIAKGTGVVSLQPGARATGAQALQAGNVALTTTAGAFGMAKMTASASAPGATGLKLEAVCGTNAGTLKIVAAAGTSATAVTVVDNVGSGVTGC